MKYKDIFKLSVRALSRQKIRTLLTSFAVFIGIFLIILMVSGTTGGSEILKEQFTSNFDLRNVIAAPKGTLQFNFSAPSVEEEDVKPLTPAAVDDLRKISGIEKIQPSISIIGKTLTLEGQEDALRNIFGAGFDIQAGDKYIKEIMAGEVRDLKENEAIISTRVAKGYELEPQDIVGKKIIIKNDPSSFFSSKVNDPGKDYEFTVIGVVDIGADNNDFLLSTNQTAKMLAEKGGFASSEEYLNEIGYDQLYITSKTEEVTEEVANQVREKGYDATTIEQILDIFGTVTNTIQIVFSMFGIIALVVASIGIINTMIMSVYERTKEIGVMKAIGASKATIRSLFLTEAAIIGFIGGLLGLLVSLGLMAIIEFVVVKYIFPAQDLEINNVFTTPLWLMIGPVVFSTFVGMLAGVYPAIRASKLRPVDALRYE